MADEQTSGDRAMNKFPRKAMRFHCLRPVHKCAVSAAHLCASPKPTFAALVNVGPKPIVNRLFAAWCVVGTSRVAKTTIPSAHFIRERKKGLTALFTDAGDGRLLGHDDLQSLCHAGGC